MVPTWFSGRYRFLASRVESHGFPATQTVSLGGQHSAAAGSSSVAKTTGYRRQWIHPGRRRRARSRVSQARHFAMQKVIAPDNQSYDYHNDTQERFSDNSSSQW
jgi:hypothetical protein